MGFSKSTKFEEGLLGDVSNVIQSTMRQKIATAQEGI